MNDLGWKRWRTAEAALGRGAAPEAAAAQLPPRQAALLRALDALERGDAASIRAAAKATEDLDIGALLDLVQAAPDDIEPTAVRSALKRGGLANEPLPKLDLLRLYAVALSGQDVSKVATLTRVANKNLVLGAALMGLCRHYDPTRIGAKLSRRSPRLAAIWAAATGMACGIQGPLRHIVEVFDGSLNLKGDTFDPERWPPVRPVHAVFGFGAAEPNTLERWLAAPLETRWDMGCQHDAEQTLGGPRDARRRLLGRLLVAIEQVLRHGRPNEVFPAVEAANLLVKGLSGLHAQDLLMLHLAQLHCRLLWWSLPTRPSLLAEGLWRLPVPLTDGERRHVAAELLAAIEPPAHDSAAVAEMLVLRLQDPHTLEVTALQALMCHADSVTAERLEQGLQGVAPWHKDLALAAHAFATGCDVEAFERAVEARLAPVEPGTAQLERVRVSTAAHLVLGAAHSLTWLDSSPRKERERLATALTRWFDAVEARQIAVEPRVLVKCVELAECLRHLGRPGLEVARIAALVRARLATPCAPDEELTLARALLAHSVGDEAAAEASFRALGRFLRGAPQERGLEAALRWSAGMIEVPHEKPRPAFARWQRALDAWLLQQPETLVGSAALALAKAEPALAPRLLDWGERMVDEEDWSSHWEALEELVALSTDLGGELDELFADEIDIDVAMAKLHELALGGPPTRQSRRLSPRQSPGRQNKTRGRSGRTRGGRNG